MLEAAIKRNAAKRRMVMFSLSCPLGGEVGLGCERDGGNRARPESHLRGPMISPAQHAAKHGMENAAVPQVLDLDRRVDPRDRTERPLATIAAHAHGELLT